MAIKCDARRSTFHVGKVKFILFIDGSKIDSTEVEFKKDDAKIVEAELHFTPTKDTHGKRTFRRSAEFAHLRDALV